MMNFTERAGADFKNIYDAIEKKLNEDKNETWNYFMDLFYEKMKKGIYELLTTDKGLRDRLDIKEIKSMSPMDKKLLDMRLDNLIDKIFHSKNQENCINQLNKVVECMNGIAIYGGKPGEKGNKETEYWIGSNSVLDKKLILKSEMDMLIDAKNIRGILENDSLEGTNLISVVIDNAVKYDNIINTTYNSLIVLYSISFVFEKSIMGQPDFNIKMSCEDFWEKCMFPLYKSSKMKNIDYLIFVIMKAIEKSLKETNNTLLSVLTDIKMDVDKCEKREKKEKIPYKSLSDFSKSIFRNIRNVIEENHLI